MSDMTAADIAFLASRRSEATCGESVDEPVLPARHVVYVTLAMIAATLLALVILAI